MTFSPTSERGEISSLLRHSYQQEHVLFKQQISLVKAGLQIFLQLQEFLQSQNEFFDFLQFQNSSETS